MINREHFIDLVVSVFSLIVWVSIIAVILPLIYLLWIPASLTIKLYLWAKNRCPWKIE